MNEMPAVQTDEYQAMQAGIAPDTCTCTVIDPGDWETPTEWEQADDCPVHPLLGTVQA
jgi:hypothetical protein